MRVNSGGKRVISDQISAIRKQERDNVEGAEIRREEKRDPRAQTGVSVPQTAQRRGTG
jgi:hypothetical protein